MLTRDKNYRKFKFCVFRVVRVRRVCIPRSKVKVQLIAAHLLVYRSLKLNNDNV